ncbi:MAG: RDD family protein [Terriglobia bacterium]
MPSKLIIETPEQIPIELPLAGIGSRFLALAIDTAIQLVASVLLLIVLASFCAFMRAGRPWLLGFAILLYFLLGIGYFVIFEALWSGQTPGKRAQRLRVIQESGRPVSSWSAVTRNLLRLVDGLPGFYAIGIVSVLVSSNSKRLGDFVAGTVVVRETPSDAAMGSGTDPAGRPAESESSWSLDAARLTPQEFQLMEAFLVRRAQLTPLVRLRLSRGILERVRAKLALAPEDFVRPESTLEKLVKAYRDDAPFVS